MSGDSARSAYSVFGAISRFVASIAITLLADTIVVIPGLTRSNPINIEGSLLAFYSEYGTLSNVGSANGISRLGLLASRD